MSNSSCIEIAGRYVLSAINSNSLIKKVDHDMRLHISNKEEGPDLNLVIPVYKIANVIKANNDTLDELCSYITTTTTTMVVCMDDDDDVDNLFDVSSESDEENNKESELDYLEKASPPSKKKKKENRPETHGVVNENANKLLSRIAHENANYKLPKKQESEKKVPADVESFFNLVYKRAQEGKIGLVPRAFQKTARKQQENVFKKKVLETEAADVCVRFYNYLKSEGLLATKNKKNKNE